MRRARATSRRPSARPSSAAPRCSSSNSRFQLEDTTMLIRVKEKLRNPDAPQRHSNHRRPLTRRELIAQGFMAGGATLLSRSEEHTSELQSQSNLVCRLLLEKKKTKYEQK